jgi:hypothetical protein
MGCKRSTLFEPVADTGIFGRAPAARPALMNDLRFQLFQMESGNPLGTSSFTLPSHDNPEKAQVASASSFETNGKDFADGHLEPLKKSVHRIIWNRPVAGRPMVISRESFHLFSALRVISTSERSMASSMGFRAVSQYSHVCPPGVSWYS